MKIYYNFFFLLSITVFLLENSVYAKPSEDTDNYYLIFVDKQKLIGNPLIEKRQEKNQLVSSLIDEINKLILENKDTYKNKFKYETLEKETELLKKRNEQDKNVESIENINNSSFIYPILNELNRIIVVAYLSSYLKDRINSMEYVDNCVPDIKFKQAEHYDPEVIFNETKWSSLWAILDSSRHLSMISQGKYDSDLISEYDTTYYYPATAGVNITVVAIDVGFNFYHFPEFSEDGVRTVKCYGRIKENKIKLVTDPEDTKKCYTEDAVNDDLIKGDNQDHGTMVLDIAGGYYQGVAPYANLYGFVNSLRYSDILIALEHIKNSNNFIPKQTIILLPFSKTIDMENNDDKILIKTLKDIFEDLNEKGFVIVTSAGNEGKEVKNIYENKIEIPCALDNVICVGGVDENYIINKNSNYGDGVDIYAPYTSYVSYNTYDDDTINLGVVYGTTFSSGITAGVVALIKSENPDTIKFNTKEMLIHLQKLALKNVVKNNFDNTNFNLYFINNGKKIVYSLDEKYNGCGINAGGVRCGKNQCCSLNGKCYDTIMNLCDISECQVKYSSCISESS